MRDGDRITAAGLRRHGRPVSAGSNTGRRGGIARAVAVWHDLEQPKNERPTRSRPAIKTSVNTMRRFGLASMAAPSLRISSPSGPCIPTRRRPPERHQSRVFRYATAANRTPPRSDQSSSARHLPGGGDAALDAEFTLRTPSAAAAKVRFCRNASNRSVHSTCFAAQSRGTAPRLWSGEMPGFHGC